MQAVVDVGAWSADHGPKSTRSAQFRMVVGEALLTARGARSAPLWRGGRKDGLRKRAVVGAVVDDDRKSALVGAGRAMRGFNVVASSAVRGAGNDAG